MAQHALMQRYCGTVYRYLLGAVRDEAVAEELFQEFALRFLRGDFRRADPAKGRFRDYLKTALSHLVTDHYRRQGRRPAPIRPDHPEPVAVDADESFEGSWREELIHQAWQALAQSQPPLHAALRQHVENPDLAAAEIAQRLSASSGKPVSAGNVRVMLHRARQKFALLLVDEVARSLESPTREELVAELRLLRWFDLCEAAVSNWAGP